MKEAGEDVMEEASPNYLCAATPWWPGELFPALAQREEPL